MNLEKRIDLLKTLGSYIKEAREPWQEAKLRAERSNAWFIIDFIDRASLSIANNFLAADKLDHFRTIYPAIEVDRPAKQVGIVMAGNIPLVGFHDLFCVFLSGHRSLVKTSTKDEVLLKHLVSKLIEWNPEVAEYIAFADMLKGCDAYIATGSSNTARYFDYYFNKYPHIIRRNRTSVAILDGNESKEELLQLSDAVNLYFGLGCRNVTKILVPQGYDFVPLLDSFEKYRFFIDHNKYKNNFDYQFAILLLDHKYYMTNGSVLLVENDSAFSAISVLNYGFYTDREALVTELEQSANIQCVTGRGLIPFSAAQDPSITDYADKVDTMKFLLSL